MGVVQQRFAFLKVDCLSDGQHHLPTLIVFSHLKIGQSELLKRKRSGKVGASRLCQALGDRNY